MSNILRAIADCASIVWVVYLTVSHIRTADYLTKIRQTVPPQVLDRLYGVVQEGQKVYGTWDNWKTRYDSQEGQLDRLIHASNHWRRWKEGDTSEDNLAKVMWFCMMMLWFEENGKDHLSPKP